MTPEPCINISLSLKLSNGKPALATALLGLLLEEIASNQVEFSRALEQDDFNEAHEVIHKLHGACCYCGVPNLNVICQRLEQHFIQQPKKHPDASDIAQFNTAVDELLLWHKGHDVKELFS